MATDVLGLRDAVVDGETGLLVPYGDLRALAEAILRMLMDHGLRERLSREAVEWAERFSWKKTAEEFMDVMLEEEDVP